MARVSAERWTPPRNPAQMAPKGAKHYVRDMKLGLLTLGDYLADPVTGVLQTQAERHRSIVEQAVLAEEVGFHSVHLGEHHFCNYILASPPVVLAAVAERTKRVRLSTGVTLAVNLDPVRVAEDYATLDLISGGRVEPVIGRGTFFPHTFRAFGQNPKVAKQVFAENAEILVRLWSEENVTWTGEHHVPLENVTVQPRPMQRPRPPIWVGAGTSTESVDLAARLGLWLMLPTVFGTPETFKPIVERYLEKWDEYGHNPADRRIGMCSHAWVSTDYASAKAEWEPRYKAYIDWVNQLIAESMGRTDVNIGEFDFDERCSTLALAGSPQQVLHRMGELQELLHLDTYLLMFDMGGMPYADIARTIELVGSTLLPQLAL